VALIPSLEPLALGLHAVEVLSVTPFLFLISRWKIMKGTAFAAPIILTSGRAFPCGHWLLRQGIRTHDYCWLLEESTYLVVKGHANHSPATRWARRSVAAIPFSHRANSTGSSRTWTVFTREPP
jgi:hypothetical protein